MKHKYRTYKNGITGHRYKRYYITAQGRKNYSVLDPQGMTVRTALPARFPAEKETQGQDGAVAWAASSGQCGRVRRVAAPLIGQRRGADALRRTDTE